MHTRISNGQWIVATVGIVAVLALALGACAADAPDGAPAPAPQAAASGPRFFASAREAVAEANALLAASDWKGLARCYDLSLTRVTEEELVSGRFFAPLAPTPAGPGLAIPRRRPFAIGSEFLSAEAQGDEGSLPCIWIVRTTFPIDQGGGMTQRVTSDCHMIQTADGWRFLPPAPIDDGHPAAASGPAPKPVSVARGEDEGVLLRPSLRDPAERDIPRGGASNIPAILAVIEKLRPLAAAHPGHVRAGVLPLEPAEVYEPTDEELLLSIAGDRIWRTTQIAPTGTLARVRSAHPELPESFEYPHIEVGRIDVAGTGPRYVASRPVVRRVGLTESIR